MPEYVDDPKHHTRVHQAARAVPGPDAENDAGAANVAQPPREHVLGAPDPTSLEAQYPARQLQHIGKLVTETNAASILSPNVSQAIDKALHTTHKGVPAASDMRLLRS